MDIKQSALWKALFGAEDDAVIKAGTLAVTRGTGVIAAAALAITNFEWGLTGLTSVHKLTASIAVVAVWAFLAAADAIARAVATIHASPHLVPLPIPLKAEVPAQAGSEEKGYLAVLAKFDHATTTGLAASYWLVKDGKGQWHRAEKVIIKSN